MADRIHVEIEGAEAVLADFVAKPGQIAAASRRAVRKVGSAAATALARELASAHGLPLKVIGRNGGNRVRFRLATRAGRRGKLTNVRAGFTSNDTDGQIWIGHNPIKSAYLGTLKQSATGASAGKHFFEGAFLATVGKHRGVFRREAFATRRTKGRPLTSSLNLRILEERVALDKAPALIERVANGIAPRLLTVLRQELNNEINVKK